MGAGLQGTNRASLATLLFGARYPAGVFLARAGLCAGRPGSVRIIEMLPASHEGLVDLALNLDLTPHCVEGHMRTVVEVGLIPDFLFRPCPLGSRNET